MSTTTIGDTSTYSAVLFDQSPSSELPSASAEYAWYLQGKVKVNFNNQISATRELMAFDRTGINAGKITFTWTISQIRLSVAQFDNVMKALAWWTANDADGDAVGRLYLYVYDGTDNAAKFGSWTSPASPTQIRVRIRSFNATLEGDQWMNCRLQVERFTA